tara:strand:+ start:545 stop:826 length:282 start_codon:yes stop_codon:yes gene_type:complete
MIRPLRNYILVERAEAETTSALGIILPDTAVDQTTEGVIIACGKGLYEGKERVPMEVKVGDNVLFTQFAGKELTVDDKTVWLMLDTDIYAVLD